MKPYNFFAAAAAIGLATACQSAPAERATSAIHVADTNTGEGQFFPPVTAVEARPVRFGAMTGASPEQRQYFTDRVNMETSGRGLTAPIVVQSTGVDQDVLVVMVSGFNEPLTPYISRGLLARMTSIIRFAPTIAEMGLSQELDVYDVAAVLGFKQIVVTDGKEVSYVTKLEL
ncbi:MAG: hypothetical protein KKC43_15695 [Alphaproteobacteria bacterium]|nr:hypothetical protein [Alphaproteobacteria bacterium]